MKQCECGHWHNEHFDSRGRCVPYSDSGKRWDDRCKCQRYVAARSFYAPSRMAVWVDRGGVRVRGYLDLHHVRGRMTTRMEFTEGPTVEEPKHVAVPIGNYFVPRLAARSSG